jgi:hypothetical protein
VTVFSCNVVCLENSSSDQEPMAQEMMIARGGSCLGEEKEVGDCNCAKEQ